jgi:hypothetical protein
MAAALCEKLLNDGTFLSIVEADLETGQHRNPTDNISFFTDAFSIATSRLGPNWKKADFR